MTQQMAQMNTYEPSPSYMQQYNNDPTFFNHEYQKYKEHLNSSADDQASPAQVQTPVAIQRNVSDMSEDRDQANIENLEVASGVQQNAQGAQGREI